MIQSRFIRQSKVEEAYFQMGWNGFCFVLFFFQFFSGFLLPNQKKLKKPKNNQKKKEKKHIRFLRIDPEMMTACPVRKGKERETPKRKKKRKIRKSRKEKQKKKEKKRSQR